MLNLLVMNIAIFVGTVSSVCREMGGRLILLVLLGLVSWSVQAQTTPSPSYPEAEWINIDSQLTVAMSAPVRSGRSPDATVKVTLTNKSTEAIKGPVRLVLKDLTTGVSLKNPAGTSASGSFAYVLATPELSLAPAAQKIIELTILGGGPKTFSFKPLVEQGKLGCSNGSTNYPECNNSGLAVVITEPKSLITIGHSPLTIKGTINRPNATLVINGNPVTHSNGQFEAQVTVEEGYNTVIASATEGTEQVTDSISVSLDLTPPYVTVESHIEGQRVSTDKITVTGLVNDIVRGTVEAEQAQVRVNGIAAVVSNRSYAANDISLQEGTNSIKVTASDQVGNTETKTFTVIYEKPDDKFIELVSGQDQTAAIGSVLPQPLVVKLLSKNGAPVVNQAVVFRVMQDSGEVAVGTPNEGRAVVVQTNAQGLASTQFRVGLRTGVANNKVKAAAVGYQGEVIFNASATTKIGNKLSVNSGNNQRGVVGQVLPAPLVAVVTDEGANVVKSARVRFEAITGGGTFENKQSSIEVATDSDGRATVRFILGDLEGLDAQHVRATLIDAPEGQNIIAGFNATGFVQADPGLTTISGVVLDNQDNPIPGITMHVEGTTRKAQTNDQGRFVIASAPVGPIHLVADGSTASIAGEFPNLGYRMVTIAGVDNPLPAPIYMVKLNTKEAVYAGKKDVEITLEKYPGFKLEIAKNSVTFPDGAREGYISVTAVNAASVPMAPPNGMQPQFIVTIQPTGTRFDAPARLSLPNVDGHAPGAQVEMYSYDHDLEEFVAIGLGTVSEDSTTIRSNIGVGVVKAGWHCGSQPGGSGTAANCPTCYKCDGSTCVKDPAQNNTPLKEQTPGDCQTATCSGSAANEGDKPTEDSIKGDCRGPGCKGKSADPTKEINDSDDPDERCKSCQGGELKDDKSKDLPEAEQTPQDCKAKTCDPENPERNADDPKEDTDLHDCKAPSCKEGKHETELAKDQTPKGADFSKHDCAAPTCVGDANGDNAKVMWEFDGSQPFDDPKNNCTVGTCVNPGGGPHASALDAGKPGFTYDPSDILENEEKQACKTIKDMCEPIIPSPDKYTSPQGKPKKDEKNVSDGSMPQAGPNEASPCYECVGGIEKRKEIKTKPPVNEVKAQFPQSVVNNVSAYLSRLGGPKIVIKEMNIEGSNFSDCCSDKDKKYYEANYIPGQGKGKVQFNAVIGMAEACWRFWPAPGFCGGKNHVRIGGVKNPITRKEHILELEVDGGVLLQAPINFVGSLGGSWDQCSDQKYCLAGSVKIEATPSIGIEMKAIGCYSVRDTSTGAIVSDSCLGAGLGARIVGKVEAGIRYDGCNPSDNGLYGEGALLAEIDGFVTLSGDNWTFAFNTKLM